MMSPCICSPDLQCRDAVDACTPYYYRLEILGFRNTYGAVSTKFNVNPCRNDLEMSKKGHVPLAGLMPCKRLGKGVPMRYRMGMKAVRFGMIFGWSENGDFHFFE